MNTKELLAGFNERMYFMRFAIDEVADENAAEHIYRELNKECRRLVPKFRPGSVLFTRIVTDTQLPLWEDFSRGSGKRK